MKKHREWIVANIEEPLEPHKCARWDWVPWSVMWNWAKQQAEAEASGQVVKKRMFRPLVNLHRDHPEMEHCLRDL